MALRDMPGYLTQPLPGVDLGAYVALTRESARQAAEDPLRLTASRLLPHRIAQGRTAAWRCLSTSRVLSGVSTRR
jgi:hypothetical protein